MTEAELKRKLAAIEAMVHGAMTDGERAAAQHVFDTFKQKTPDEVSQELAFTVHDVWARKLFMAMLRKAGLEPYRMRGQRRTTIMIQGRKSLVPGHSGFDKFRPRVAPQAGRRSLDTTARVFGGPCRERRAT